MDETKYPSNLRVLLIGNREKLDQLERALSQHPRVEVIGRDDSAEYSFGLIRHSCNTPGDVEAVFIDPFADAYDPRASSSFILNARATHPEVVFVLLVGREELLLRRNEFDPELRSRIDHYYSLDPEMEPGGLAPALARAIEACIAWRETPRSVSSRHNFEYDVAISFAGEDRQFAESIADALTRRNVRVFLDYYYQAELWGKDLYTALYDIYYRKARYCMILASRAYRDKMWTGHERQAAQARALEMRGHEYILPIRLEDIDIQGIPPTVAYLPGSLGVEEIAKIFIAKLAHAN